MNPAMGYIPELPCIVDLSGSAHEDFKRLLVSEEEDDADLTMLCKGEAYVGHGHDLAAIRFNRTGTMLRTLLPVRQKALGDSTWLEVS